MTLPLPSRNRYTPGLSGRFFRCSERAVPIPIEDMEQQITALARERLGFESLRPGPARGGHVGHRRPRHAVRDVDRLGQVGDLPARRLRHRRADRRRLPAHRPPAGPDGGRRGGGGRHQLDADRPPARGGPRGRPGRRGRVRPPRPRAARQRGRDQRAAPTPASASSSSTRRTASASGATTSAPTTCASARRSPRSATRPSSR